jgi:hypothetical protein
MVSSHIGMCEVIVFLFQACLSYFREHAVELETVLTILHSLKASLGSHCLQAPEDGLQVGLIVSEVCWSALVSLSELMGNTGLTDPYCCSFASTTMLSYMPLLPMGMRPLWWNVCR